MRSAFPGRTAGPGLVAVALLALVQLGVLLAPAGTAWAQPLGGHSPGKHQVALHPLGNFSINRYDGLTVTPDQLRVDHVQDFAEIPTTQLQKTVDTNDNGILAEEELATWATPRCRTAARELEARLDERPVRFALQTARAQTRDGQAGLRTLRLECAFAAPIPPAGAEAQLVFVDRASTEGIAWREISARAEGASLAASDVPEDSVSNRLLTYPEANLDSPLNQRAANLTIRADGGRTSIEPAPEQPANSVLETVLPRGADRLTVGFMSMISRQDLTLGIGLTAIISPPSPWAPRTRRHRATARPSWPRTPPVAASTRCVRCSRSEPRSP
ncbi:hypothetical protein [Actinopolymorpha pittospori]|uniref:EF-hand domain-containing protein n=1 Tax=Actinopolymorpha pittospori TaxID=648752 RepID=A0A927MYF9_9ACTN|nr:hypothetical protein [Actinopolymorpha pittospori]MBE1609261.1 hypothetical protein [Actinopolymorpha pittospori]